MITIYKRELRALYLGYRGYAFTAIFIALYCVVRMVYNYFNSYETSLGYFNAEYMLTFLPVAFALAVPVVTFSVFERERSDDAYTLLRSLPIKPLGVIFGKYFSILTAFAVPYVMLIAFDLVLGAYKGVAILTVVLSHVAYILICNAILAVSFFCAAVIKNKIVALLVSYGISLGYIGFYALAQLCHVGIWREMLLRMSVVGTYTSALLGRFDFASLVLWISVGAVFLVLAVRCVRKEMEGENKVFAKVSAMAIVSAAMAAVIIANISLGLIPVGFRTVDTTKNGAYTPAEETQEVLQSLDEDITVYVINASGLDTRYEYLLEVIDSYDRIDVKWSDFEDVADKADALGLTEDKAGAYCIIVESEKRSISYDYFSLIRMANKNSTLLTYIQALSSSTGVAYADINNGKAEMTLTQYQAVGNKIYSDAAKNANYAAAYETMLSSLLNDSEVYFYGENMLCRAVEYVTVDIIPARYLLSGHGGADMSKSILGALMLPQLGLNYMPLDISVSGIPEDAVDIIIATPGTDITAEEVSKLEAYVERGGMITLFTDGDCANLPNLMALMNKYGMTLKAGTVTERIEKDADKSGAENSSGAVAQGDVAGPLPDDGKYEYTDSVKVSLNTEHKGLMALANNTQIIPVIDKGNEIIYESNAEKGIKVTPLLTTSQNCFVGDNDADLDYRALAVIAELGGEKGGKVLWYTGGSSFTGEVTEDMTDKEQSNMVSNCMVAACTSGLAPFTYESTITAPAGKVHSERFMNVTDIGYIWSVILPVIAVVIASVVGAILVYIRKKA